MKRVIGVICVSLWLPASAPAQEIDPRLATYIGAIRAIDNHAHVVAPDMERDTAYDALRCETLGPGTALPPANVRFGPDLQAAWKTLYGFAGTSASPETLKQWQARQAAAREARGAGYFDWVLDQAGLDIVVANRVTMATQLDARHFRWVPYDDALLFPLDNRVQKAQNPDRKILYEAEEQLLKTYLSAVGVSRLPSTLDAYLDQVVVAMLKDQKSHGAVAIKFEVAYSAIARVPAGHA